MAGNFSHKSVSCGYLMIAFDSLIDCLHLIKIIDGNRRVVKTKLHYELFHAYVRS